MPKLFQISFLEQWGGDKKMGIAVKCRNVGNSYFRLEFYVLGLSHQRNGNCICFWDKLSFMGAPWKLGNKSYTLLGIKGKQH